MPFPSSGDYSLILFKMDKGKAILEPKELYFSQEKDPSGETVGYYYSLSVDFDINKAEKLEPEQFPSTIEAITDRVIAPEYTSFLWNQSE